MHNIKRIIFDLDGTLIPWHTEYQEAVKKAVAEYNIPLSYELIDSTYITFEDHYSNYSYKNFQKHIKELFNINVSLKFIKAWMEYLGDMAMPADKELIKTLQYLKGKYDLVVLTNDFGLSQTKRLEKAGILNFFTEIYDGETVIKPNKQSYLNACGPYAKEECLMIGDNFNKDYQGAINAGLKAIHLNEKEKSNKKDHIQNLTELREIL